MELHLAIFIGAHTIIRYIALLAGAYENDSEMVFGLKSGVYEIPAKIYF